MAQFPAGEAGENRMFPRCGPVPTYAVFYVAGLVVYLLIVLNLAGRMSVRQRLARMIGICYPLGMILGAKILFDLLHQAFSWSDLVRVRHYTEDGGMWGGPMAFLALAVPLVVIMARGRHERRAALDLIALALPIPLIFAKIACLCHGCCEGRPCAWPWAIRFPAGGSAPAGVPLHPTQIYEMIVLVLVMIVLVRLNRPAWRGLLLAWFLVLYGAGRAFIESWRGDALHRTPLGPLTASQAILLLVTIASAVWIAASAARHRSRAHVS